MKEILEHLINEHGLPAVLRGITAFGRAKYEKHLQRQGELFLQHKGSESWYHREFSAEERKEQDIAFAYASVDLGWCVDLFEKRVSEAGLSDEEKRQIDLKKDFDKAQRELARIKERMADNLALHQ